MARRNKKCKDCDKMVLETSERCNSCAQKERFTRMNVWNAGKTKETDKRLDYERPTKFKKKDKRITGKEHYLWKGENVGYVGLHQWVIRMKGIARTCVICGKGQTDNNKGVHWANVDWQYKRNLNDFIELCVRCHMLWDREKLPVNLYELNERRKY